MFNPRRFGAEASAVEATAVGLKAPSVMPIRARIRIRDMSPPASPVNTEHSENKMMPGIMTLRRPKRSESRPMNRAEMPQASPRAPMMLPRSA